VDRARASIRSLTPPVDRRETALVGRHARLELVFACRQGKTVLAAAYAEPPLRVGRCFPEGAGLHMILASSAPGIFGGDSLWQSVRVERGARVRLTSQSALQVHPAADGSAARLTSTYHVDDEGELRCHWDPVIPFAGATLQQHIDIHLAERGYLEWSDGYMSGRQGRGERWMFAELAHELRVCRAGSLEYLERYRLAPADRAVSRRWMAGASAYFGTTIASGPRVRSEMAEPLHRELMRLKGVHAAADALGRGLVLVRLMAESGVPFHEARAMCLAALRTDS
jgi:urease accessory protein UreH